MQKMINHIVREWEDVVVNNLWCEGIVAQVFVARSFLLVFYSTLSYQLPFVIMVIITITHLLYIRIAPKASQFNN